MNTNHVPLAFLAATLFLLSPGMAASSETAETSPPRRGARSAEKDAAAMKASRDKELLKRYDRNGDGKLDEDEVAAAKIEMLQRGQEQRSQRAGKFREEAKAFDADRDGQLSAEELAKLLNERPFLKRRLDKNGDGKVDAKEAEAAREAFKQKRGAAKGKER